MAKACASNGAEKTGAPSSLRGIGATEAAAPASPSGRLKLALQSVGRDRGVRNRRVAPQLPSRETHGVEPLRALALSRRVRIWKDVGAVHPLDDAAFAAPIARQARVAGRVHVASDDRIPNREPRRSLGRTLGR